MNDVTASTVHDRTLAATQGARRRSLLAIVATALLTGTLVASTAGAGGLLEPPPVGDSTFVPITPCRLFDTRPGTDNVGPRDTPLGHGETHVQQVTGANGDCTIPFHATGVAVNATAVGASQPSFLTFFPADAERPLSSNLNTAPGAPPTPNKVDVKLSNDGKLAIYHAFGSVDLVGDIVGYYTDEHLDRIDADVDALQAQRPFADEVLQDGFTALTTDHMTIVEVFVPIDARGRVTLNYSATVLASDPGTGIECQPSWSGTTDGSPSAGQPTPTQRWESPGPDGGVSTISGTRSVSVSSGAQATFRVRCRKDGGGPAVVEDTVLTYSYTPSRRS